MNCWLLLLLAVSGVQSFPRQPRLREFPQEWRQQYAITISSSVLSRVPPGARLISARGEIPPLIGRLVHNASSIRHNIVDTFTCNDRVYGYYADQDNDCQIFHICVPMQQLFPDFYTTQDIFHFSFICPGYTIFSQDAMVCAWEDSAFPCSEAHQLYHRNNHFFVVPAEDIQKTTTTASTATPSTSSTPSFSQRPSVRSNYRHNRYRNTLSATSTSSTSPSPAGILNPTPSTVSSLDTSSTMSSSSTSPSTVGSSSTSPSILSSPASFPSTPFSPSTSPITLHSPITASDPTPSPSQVIDQSPSPSKENNPTSSPSTVSNPDPSPTPLSGLDPSPSTVSNPDPSPTPVRKPDSPLSTVSSQSTTPSPSPTRNFRPEWWVNYRHRYRFAPNQQFRSRHTSRLRASVPSDTSSIFSTTTEEETDTFSPSTPLY